MKQLTYFAMLLVLLGFTACKNEGNADEKEKQVEQVSNDTLKLTELWKTDTLLITSESVIFDEERNVFYVSCINGVSPWIHDGDGFIAKLGADGEIEEQKWVEGISGPKGMGIDGDFLYVTDINQVVKIDIPKGEIVERIPIEGGENINDLAIAHDGDVFVSDSKSSAIYKITDGEVTKLLQDSTLIGINGLYMKEDTLFFASYNNGSVYRIQHDDLTPRKLVSLPSGGDGVEMYRDGFIISSWEGRVFQVRKDWTFVELMNSTAEKINTADIEVVEDKNLLLIPTFFDNRVVAYEMKY
jgi:hypothetical protein